MISTTPHATSGIFPNIRKFFTDLKKGEMYLKETEFGLRRILPLLEDLSSGARVLEVGSGPCLVLSPNYGFPYKSHFRLPIIRNKTLTGKVLCSYIDRFEKANDNEGLFRSLNFMKMAEVRREVRQKNLELSINTDIIREMMDRLDNDPSFSWRQGIFTWPASLLKRSGLLEPLLHSPMVQNRLPYMQFVLCRSI